MDLVRIIPEPQLELAFNTGQGKVRQKIKWYYERTVALGDTHHGNSRLPIMKSTAAKIKMGNAIYQYVIGKKIGQN